MKATLIFLLCAALATPLFAGERPTALLIIDIQEFYFSGGAIAMGWAVEHSDQLAGLMLCNTGIEVPAGRRAPGLIRLAAP